MRSMRLIAFAAATLVVGAACGGDDGGTGTQNQAPTARFAPPACTQLSCTFNDQSTDDKGIASRSWDFGDNSTPATEPTPTHVYAQAGTYNVKLAVTDTEGLSDDSTVAVTVTQDGQTQGPTAGFTVACNGADCTFTNTSTATSGALTYQWDFGEPASGANNTSTAANPAHTYTVTDVTPFTVTLIATDAAGAADTASQTITVTPPASLQCDNGGTLSNCTLNVTSDAVLTATIASSDCELGGNRLFVVSPIQYRESVFFNMCSQPIGASKTLNAGTAIVAGTQLQFQFTQGAGDPTDPDRGPPAIKLSGTFPDWTIQIDDGGNPAGAGEPDFNDIVVTVHAQ